MYLFNKPSPLVAFNMYCSNDVLRELQKFLSCSWLNRFFKNSLFSHDPEEKI